MSREIFGRDADEVLRECDDYFGRGLLAAMSVPPLVALLIVVVDEAMFRLILFMGWV